MLIACQRAIPWVDARVRKAEEIDPTPDGSASWPTAADRSSGEGEPPERRPYGRLEQDRAAKLIGGAIFEVDLDVTHPLAYGYRRQTLPVFRNTA